jgi:membrane protease subunit HflK
MEMMARYRVRDAALWVLYGPDENTILRTEVTAAMIRTLGEMEVDRVLSDGRKDLVATAMRRAQEGLDAARSGLEITSLELKQLGPPAALAADFSAVQSAFIQSETAKKLALAFAETAVPAATAEVDAGLQAARATVATDIAVAAGDAQAFRALAREYRANPSVVRERLYRDAMERVLSIAHVIWVPPPERGGYRGLRIEIGPNGISAPRYGSPDEDQ